MQSVIELCCVDNEDCLRIQDSDPYNTSNCSLPIHVKEVLWAKKILCKPSLHRLYELIQATTLM